MRVLYFGCSVYVCVLKTDFLSLNSGFTNQLENRLKIICLCLCRSGLNHSAHGHLRVEPELITCK